MRIISQDGTVDVPYEESHLQMIPRVEAGTYKSGPYLSISSPHLCTHMHFCETDGDVIAEMQKIRKAYADGEKLYQIGGE